MMIIIRTFGAIALALFVSAANAHAADVVILSTKITDDPVCNLRLSGPIGSGDSTKIDTIVDGVQQRSGGWSGIIGDSPTLCLNSPGGSYTEGLKIANLVLGRHIRTMIEPHAICYSSCAVIFMAGGFTFEGPHFPHRRLHVTGQLGFHAPYINGVPQQTYSSLDLENAYKSTIRAIRDLIKLGQKYRVTNDFMPKALIGAIVDKEPNELFLVDTVFKAAKLNVGVYGDRKTPITIAGLCNACVSFHFGADIEWPLDDPPGNCDPSKQGVERRGNQTWIGGFGSEGSGYCVAQAPSPYGAPFGVSQKIIYDKKDRPKKDDFYAPYNWYLYPPATKIQSLE
jgi:hypothetical protein